MSNKKKPLLNENTVRRWSVLANTESLVGNFIKENYEEEGKHMEEEGKHLEDEGKHMEEEGKKLSQTPVKQGGNKTLAEKKHKEEEGKHLEDENKHMEEEGKHMEEEGMEDEAVPEAPVGEPDHMEPDGDEGGMGGDEGNVQALVKAIADAITAQTGVAVDVAGAGSAPGAPVGSEEPAGPMGKEPAMDEKSMEDESKVSERSRHRTHDASKLHTHELPENKTLKEEFSDPPVVTKPSKENQGTVKDPTASKVKVQGVEKPDAYLGKTSAGYPNHMKTLEEKLLKSVLERILEMKKTKAPVKK